MKNVRVPLGRVPAAVSAFRRPARLLLLLPPAAAPAPDPAPDPDAPPGLKVRSALAARECHERPRDDPDPEPEPEPEPSASGWLEEDVER